MSNSTTKTYTELYTASVAEALMRKEFEQWRESYRCNCNCSDTIAQNITQNFHDNHLTIDTDELVDQFGIERIGWVLANTINMKNYDGRFSPSNKEWASAYPVPTGDARGHFCVQAHSGLVDLFTTELRKEYPEMCWPEQQMEDLAMGGM